MSEPIKSSKALSLILQVPTILRVSFSETCSLSILKFFTRPEIFDETFSRTAS